MVSVILSRLVILVLGTLYPAYASYKAVKTKNVREYVKWMMYWIVFALFTCAETLADLFVAFWFPFYYELKVLFVLWLLSPATKGSSILYRKFVHPQLLRREEEIDQFLLKARDQGYTAVVQLGSKGLNYAAGVVMQTALKGQETLATHLCKSQSIADLSVEPPRKRGRPKKLESDTSSESSKSHGEGPRRSSRKKTTKESNTIVIQ